MSRWQRWFSVTPQEIGMTDGNDLQWERTTDSYWKYRVRAPYSYVYKYPMKLGADQYLFEGPFYRATRFGITLLPDMTWNGSNVVIDTDSDMEASGVHDPTCQLMELGFYLANLSNWNRAAREYRHNCRTHGMSRRRSWARYFGLLVGGGNGYKWRGVLQRLGR